MCLDWAFPSEYLTFPTSFSTVNPRFLQDDLFFSKKSVYMKNAEQQAGFETFCWKSWFFKYSLSKSTKTTRNCAIYLLCGFLRNWPVIISMICGHKISLSSYRCHFKAIASWKALFKPQFAMITRVHSAIRDVSVPLRAGARAACMIISNCMKM